MSETREFRELNRKIVASDGCEYDTHTASQLLTSLTAKVAALEAELEEVKLERTRANLRAKSLDVKIVLLEAERDHWKANHDNQVEIKQLIASRPDMGDRAIRIEGLFERLQQCERERDEARANLYAVVSEFDCMAKISPTGVVRVREGGGPENLAATVALTIAKLQKMYTDGCAGTMSRLGRIFQLETDAQGYKDQRDAAIAARNLLEEEVKAARGLLTDAGILVHVPSPKEWITATENDDTANTYINARAAVDAAKILEVGE